MTTIYRPPAQTPAGIEIARHVSEILAYTAELEERLIRASTEEKMSHLERKIMDRIDVLMSERQLAAYLGDEDACDKRTSLIKELRGLLENGE